MKTILGIGLFNVYLNLPTIENLGMNYLSTIIKR